MSETHVVSGQDRPNKARRPRLAKQYRNELLKLSFAEDQAAMYTEGFMAMSGHSFVRHQMKLLAEETRLQHVEILSLFNFDEDDLNESSTKTECEVAMEIRYNLGREAILLRDDAGIVESALRLQYILVGRYWQIADLARKLHHQDDQCRFLEIHYQKVRRAMLIFEAFGETPTNSSSSLAANRHSHPPAPSDPYSRFRRA